MIATFPSESVNAHVERLTDWIMSTEEAGRFLARNRGTANILLLLDGGRALACIDHAAGWDFQQASALARAKGFDRFFWENTDGRRGEGRLRGTGGYDRVARRILSTVA